MLPVLSPSLNIGLRAWRIHVRARYACVPFLLLTCARTEDRSPVQFDSLAAVAGTRGDFHDCIPDLLFGQGLDRGLEKSLAPAQVKKSIVSATFSAPLYNSEL